MTSTAQALKKLKQHEDVKEAKNLAQRKPHIEVTFKEEKHTYLVISFMALDGWRVKTTSLDGSEITFVKEQ